MLRLRFERKRKGWSQADLAKRLRVRQQTVALWESCRRSPSLRHLLRLGKVFQCEPTRLLGGYSGHKPHLPTVKR